MVLCGRVGLYANRPSESLPILCRMTRAPVPALGEDRINGTNQFLQQLRAEPLNGTAPEPGGTDLEPGQARVPFGSILVPSLVLTQVIDIRE